MDTSAPASEEALQPKAKKAWCSRIKPTPSIPKSRKCRADTAEEQDSPKRAKKDMKKKKKKTKKEGAPSPGSKGADDSEHASEPEAHGPTMEQGQDSLDKSIQMKDQPHLSVVAPEPFEQYLMGTSYRSPLNTRASVTASTTTASTMQIFPGYMGDFLRELRQAIIKAPAIAVKAKVVTSTTTRLTETVQVTTGKWKPLSLAEPILEQSQSVTACLKQSQPATTKVEITKTSGEESIPLTSVLVDSVDPVGIGVIGFTSMPVCETMPEVGLSPTMGTNTTVTILAMLPALEPQEADQPMDTSVKASLPGGDEHSPSEAAGGEEPMVTTAEAPAAEPSSPSSPRSMLHPSQEEGNDQASEGDQPKEPSCSLEGPETSGEEEMDTQESAREAPVPTNKPEMGTVTQETAGPSRRDTSGGAQINPTGPAVDLSARRPRGSTQ